VPYDAERLVIRGDEEIDRRPLGRIAGQRGRRSVQRPEALKIAEDKDGGRVGFSEQQEADEEGVQRAPVRAGTAEEAGGRGKSPEA